MEVCGLLAPFLFLERCSFTPGKEIQGWLFTAYGPTYAPKSFNVLSYLATIHTSPNRNPVNEILIMQTYDFKNVYSINFMWRP